MYLLNGESKQSIDFSDRGFQYGDGLFETIEVLNGKPLFLKQHFQRLFLGCYKLQIPPPDIVLLTKEAVQVSQGSMHAVLKLIVTRGSGGRGYRQPGTIKPTRLFSLHSFPNYPENFSQQGVSVLFCSTPLGLNPFLAGIKHLNRLEQVLARSEWNSTDVQEGIMLDIKGNIIEGTMSNIFVAKENILYTPLIEMCGVDGVLRNIIIFLARKNQIKVVEKIICKDEIDTADELFLTNSIIGVWPIKQIDKRCYGIGVLTKQLQDYFLAFKNEEANVC